MVIFTRGVLLPLDTISLFLFAGHLPLCILSLGRLESLLIIESLFEMVSSVHCVDESQVRDISKRFYWTGFRLFRPLASSLALSITVKERDTQNSALSNISFHLSRHPVKCPTPTRASRPPLSRYTRVYRRLF